MPVLRLWILRGLACALTLNVVSPAKAQQTPPTEEPPAIEVASVTLEPKNAKLGDEITVTAAILNTRSQVVLVNVRVASRILLMEGYRRDDSMQILGLDEYRLTLSEDRTEINGVSREHGAWRATFALTPK